MSTFWLKAFELILSLSLLVFIHEFGHYMWARIFGVKVEKFYLFFNPWVTLMAWLPKTKKVSVLRTSKGAVYESEGVETEKESSSKKATWRDTEYGLGWLPLGGYCAIAGMIDETQGADKLSSEPQPWEFRTQATWKRLLIMVGGVLNNFLLAIFIYAGMVWYWGEQYLPFTSATEGITYSETAHKAGFQDNDIPLMADGDAVRYFDSDQLKIAMAKEVKVLRGKKDTVTISIPDQFVLQVNSDLENGEPFMSCNVPTIVKATMPGTGAEKAGFQEGDKLVAVNGVATPSFTQFTEQLKRNSGKTIPVQLIRGEKTVTTQAEVDGDGKLGFEVLADVSKLFKTEQHSYSFFQSVPRGIEMGCSQLVSYVKAFKTVFSKEGAKNLGGFGSIGHIFPEEWDWYSFWSITAFLSVILAFMNILPIPALDGGHVLFLLYEMITRRKPSEKFMEWAQTAGMVFLIALLLFANANDIYRFFIK